jgi:hypothetical protein
MRPGPDEIDIWGMDWAKQRRIMLGIIPGSMIPLRDHIGKIRCTLAQVREDGDGAGQNTLNGHPNQDWPEVYTGLSLTVHRAYSVMPGINKQIMNLHYVWREISARLKAEELGVSLAQYWIHVGNTKSFLFGAVTINRPVDVSRASR